MLTNTDLKKMKEVFLVKSDLTDFRAVVREEVRDELTQFKKEIYEDMKGLQSELLSEMQNLRDDLHISTDGYGDRLEEHNQRLRKVEEKCDIIST
jgi:gas vesicle protein